MSDPSVSTRAVVASAPDGLPAAGRIPIGRRGFIAGLAGTAAATGLATTGLGTTVNAAGVPNGASYFVPVDPVRLADTRRFAPYSDIAKNFQQVDDRTIRIKLSGRGDFVLPANAVAVVVTITAPYTIGPGWVQVVPAGQTTEVSNINMESGDSVVANLATVKIGPDSSIDVRGHFPYDVIVDIAGVYVATSRPMKEGRMAFLSKVQRVLPRTFIGERQKTTVSLSSYIPPTAKAVVLNLTVTECSQYGYLTAYPSNLASPPNASNINFAPGETRAAGAIVKLTEGGSPSINIYSHGNTQMIVDVTGYITGTGDVESINGLFVPVDPYRVMDTRRAADRAVTGKKRLWPKWTRAFKLPSGSNGFGQRTEIAGVAMNTTLVTSMSGNGGFVTVLPAQTVRDEVSNLNVSRVGHVVANHVIARVSDAGVECYAQCGGDMICDIGGWYVGSPQGVNYGSVTADPPPPEIGPNWIVQVDAMGLRNYVVDGPNGDPIVNAGNSWHWTNTGRIGGGAVSIVAFGHRVSHGAPYRYQDRLVAGHRLFIETSDQRTYEFEMVQEQITDANAYNILNAARAYPGPTFSLVSCTGTRNSPNRQASGGVAFRMVSTFRQLNWVDTRPET